MIVVQELDLVNLVRSLYEKFHSLTLTMLSTSISVVLSIALSHFLAKILSPIMYSPVLVLVLTIVSVIPMTVFITALFVRIGLSTWLMKLLWKIVIFFLKKPPPRAFGLKISEIFIPWSLAVVPSLVNIIVFLDETFQPIELHSKISLQKYVGEDKCHIPGVLPQHLASSKYKGFDPMHLAKLIFMSFQLNFLLKLVDLLKFKVGPKELGEYLEGGSFTLKSPSEETDEIEILLIYEKTQEYIYPPEIMWSSRIFIEIIFRHKVLKVEYSLLFDIQPRARLVQDENVLPFHVLAIEVPTYISVVVNGIEAKTLEYVWRLQSGLNDERVRFDFSSLLHDRWLRRHVLLTSLARHLIKKERLRPKEAYEKAREIVKTLEWLLRVPLPAHSL